MFYEFFVVKLIDNFGSQWLLISFIVCILNYWIKKEKSKKKY
jgi:hypothetical protein